jgi:FMN phosphatase YigB (HAD superfamily)
MMIRAFVFDIYNTLLEVGPAPPDAEARWLRLCQKLRGGNPGTQAGCPRQGLRLCQEPGGGAPALSLAEFDGKCREAIGSRRALAQARGIQFPEVFWPDITRAVFPALASLSEDRLDDFLYEHAQLERTPRLMTGAGEALAESSRRGAILGLCSNCQPYTLRELAGALAQAGLSPGLFDAQLCFYSFRAGFGKPDPNAFGRLEHELAARQLAVAEVLFVGDSLDNDIHPAQSRGWPAWHLAAAPEGRLGGDWFRLLEFVRQHT